MMTVGLILVIVGGGFGFYLSMGNEESKDEESHSSELQASDSTYNENSHQPTKTIEEIENEHTQLIRKMGELNSRVDDFSTNEN